MKKVISILIAFTLVFAFVGCEPVEEGEGGKTPTVTYCDICGEKKAECVCNAAGLENLDADAIAALAEIGLVPADIPVPKGAKYYDCQYGTASGNETFVAYWTNANQTMFNYYFTNNQYRAATDTKNLTKTKFNNATIAFYAADDYGLSGFEIPAGTIVFTGTQGIKAAE